MTEKIKEAKDLWDAEIKWCSERGFSPKYEICVKIAYLTGENPDDVFMKIREESGIKLGLF